MRITSVVFDLHHRAVRSAEMIDHKSSCASIVVRTSSALNLETLNLETVVLHERTVLLFLTNI